uniref:Uncharacterized protein n=1 Tax=Physcomitrium patens TaxID=3218 RepID=A0A2K1IX54_PHYPA|nr:hypothetical protein PHYPA_023679 [Physcomitrium patens]
MTQYRSGILGCCDRAEVTRRSISRRGRKRGARVVALGDHKSRSESINSRGEAVLESHDELEAALVLRDKAELAMREDFTAEVFDTKHLRCGAVIWYKLQQNNKK